ncbi:MAG: hypothetical protein R3F20_06315 [Planctomycetota bacterium]
MHRRDFNRWLSVAPFLFGAEGLVAHDAVRLPDENDRRIPPGRPEALAHGLARMKERGLPGVVLRIPADQDERRALGRSLLRLVLGIDAPRSVSWSPRGRATTTLSQVRYRSVGVRTALRGSCVLVCLHASEIEATFEEADAILGIDADARVFDGLTHYPKAMDLFLPDTLAQVAFGAKLERLRDLARRERATWSVWETLVMRGRMVALEAEMVGRPVVDPALELDACLRPHVEGLTTFLRRRPRAWPVLAEHLLTPPADWHDTAHVTGLEVAAEAILAGDDGLPFGTRRVAFLGHGCGGFVEADRPDTHVEAPRSDLPACGMSASVNLGGRYLRFVGDERYEKEGR